MLNRHLGNRPNLRTSGSMVANPWLFPGYHPETHLEPQTIMLRLRKLGVNPSHRSGGQDNMQGSNMQGLPVTSTDFDAAGPAQCRV
jgi:hypothetical protein